MHHVTSYNEFTSDEWIANKIKAIFLLFNLSFWLFWWLGCSYITDSHCHNSLSLQCSKSDVWAFKAYLSHHLTLTLVSIFAYSSAFLTSCLFLPTNDEDTLYKYILKLAECRVLMHCGLLIIGVLNDTTVICRSGNWSTLFKSPWIRNMIFRNQG